MTAAVKVATYEDLLALPDHLVGEIVDGVLHANPRPASPHAAAAIVLGAELLIPFDRGRGGPGGWIILSEPELHLGADIVVPDIAGWRRERMPIIPRLPYFTLAPDWLCEVLSPGTKTFDRKEKLPLYAKEGVDHVWLIDPLERSLEVLRREGTKWLIVGFYNDDDRVRAEPFEAIELDLAGLWSNVAPE